MASGGGGGGNGGGDAAGHGDWRAVAEAAEARAAAAEAAVDEQNTKLLQMDALLLSTRRCVVPDCNSGHQRVLFGWSWCP